MSFESDMRKFEQKVAGASEATISATAQQLGAAIIAATPIGNIDKWESVKEWRSHEGNSGTPPWLEGYIGGTARGNWQTSVVSRPRGELDHRPAAAAVAELDLAAATYTLDKTIYIANNLPYIQRLEEGHSYQAPQGMVATNIASFQRAIASNAQRNRI